MQRHTIAIGAAALVLALGGRALLGDRSLVQEGGAEAARARAEPFVGARELLHARPFRLRQPYDYEWSAERITVRSGWLLVLQDDPVLCEPRQEAEPVLYAGALPLERINSGRDGGRVVAILPAGLDEGGAPLLDLAATEFFRGRPELPERITRALGEAELGAARAAGVAPFAGEAVSAAIQGELLEFRDRDELRRHAAGLVLRWAEPERELAEGMLVPRVR